MAGIGERLGQIASELEDIAVDPEAMGLIESIVHIFGEQWWERQEDRRLAVWYERAQAYLALRSANDK